MVRFALFGAGRIARSMPPIAPNPRADLLRV